MSFINKKYVYKIFDSAGNYLLTWSDVINDPVFSEVINGGADVMTIQLARSANAFGEGDDVTFNNGVEVWCSDVDALAGTLVFSGYISQYTPTLKGQEQYLEVEVYSRFAELNRIMYENSGTGSTEIVHAAVSPLVIFEDIFDKFTAAGGIPDYSGSSVDDPGTVVTYTFNTNTCKEAIDKVMELSPYGWYYRINPDNTVEYHESDIINIDHTFTIGKDVMMIQPNKRIQSIVNVLYFVGGDPGTGKLYKKYTRPASITAYGTYLKKYVDGRVTNEATADIIAGRILDAFEAPEVRTKITIVDNNGSADGFGYDIESIKVGQTARVLGFTTNVFTLWDEAEWDIDVWDYSITDITAIPQQIQKITYNATNIEIELSNRLPDIAKRIEDINRNLVDSLTGDNPAIPLT